MKLCHFLSDTMKRTCPKCCREFAHASSLSKHKKTCGGGAPRLSCPFCSTTFSRSYDLKRHLDRYCKQRPTTAPLSTKRPAEQCLPETKRRLVDYGSLDEEEEDVVCEEEPAVVCEEEDEPQPGGEEEPEEEEEEEDFNLEAIKEALPWAEYTGMGEEEFAAATQPTGGNPLFHFEFSPVSEQQWLKRVEKTVYRTRLRQRRLPNNSDDVGVAIVNALETSTRQHLERIGAREEDRVFLAITAHDFNHVYQTSEFTVREFMAGSTRLEVLMRKLAGKLNSNKSFHPDQGFQLDLTLVRPLGRGSGNDKKLNPGRMGYALSRQMKNSIVEIKNKDELCCARAL